jgi:cytochrome c-type biogenesis protein CcmF
MPMTEAAIARSPWRDVYLSIGEVAADGRWIVRLQIKPFVGWIWGGAVLIALGGALSAADRRRRATRAAAAVAAPSSSAAALPVAVPTLPA